MKHIKRILILSLTILIVFSSYCEECDDCLELTIKNVKYVDSDGTNLLFGDHAIYNPDSIVIKVGNDNAVSVEKQEDTGTTPDLSDWVRLTPFIPILGTGSTGLPEICSGQAVPSLHPGSSL